MMILGGWGGAAGGACQEAGHSQGGPLEMKAGDRRRGGRVGGARAIFLDLSFLTCSVGALD